MMRGAKGHDNAFRIFYEAVWDLLVEHVGAHNDSDDKEAFVRAFTRIDHPASEWRFQGTLGFGGKFYRSNEEFWVACYPEDRTPEKAQLLEGRGRSRHCLVTLVQHPRGQGEIGQDLV